MQIQWSPSKSKIPGCFKIRSGFKQDGFNFHLAQETSKGELWLQKPFTGSRMEILGKIGMQTDDVRWVECIQNSGDGVNAKWIECKQCSSAHFFYRHSDRSFHFQAISAVDLTLDAKDQLVSLNASDLSLSATCDEFKRLHHEKNRPTASTMRRPVIRVLKTDSVHRRRLSVIRRPVTTEGVEYASPNFVLGDPQNSLY